MPVKDYYKLLKIAHSADLNTIKKAYRQLAMQYHPDKHGNDQSTHFYFQEIQEAYEVLSNPEKRENYHYQIWLEKAQGHELDTALSADQIIQLFIHTERTIHETDSFRRNNEQLTEILLNLYSYT
jgi:curved DNA-binding protein CbpA